MPQKPLDASDETVRLTLRLTKRLTDGLDDVRGSTSRSEYLRNLLIVAITQQDLPKATAPVPDARKSGGMISKLKIVPETVHRHRYTEQSEEPVGRGTKGRMSVPYYEHRCSCGLTRVGPADEE